MTEAAPLGGDASAPRGGWRTARVVEVDHPVAGGVRLRLDVTVTTIDTRGNTAAADSAERTGALDDDLRLCRWGLLPVLAALLAGPPDLAETPSEFARCYAPGWTVHKAAGLAAYHRDDLHLYAPFAGGAVARIYRGERLILEDLGLHIRDGDKTFAVRDYDSNRPSSGDGKRRFHIDLLRRDAISSRASCNGSCCAQDR